MTYINQNMKKARVTLIAASATITKTTPPAMAPESLSPLVPIPSLVLLSGLSIFPGGE